MNRNLRFDVNNNIEPFTLILAHRNHDYYGNINTATDIVFSDNIQPNHELSFVVHKEIFENGVKIKCNVWDEIKDLRYVFVPELMEFFNIKVNISKSNETTKNITATNASVDELTNVKLYDIEINTENDILREDYTEPTIFYNADNPSASLLNRIFEKAAHYTIKYVDPTLQNIQRTFAISDTNIYDFCTTTLADEIGCLFVFDSVERGVYVYDLWNTCNDCDYRGDFMDVCPECGSTNISKGYGEDTTIFVSTENLAESINLEVDTGQIKNCFRIEGGDDLITATVANCNPNGSNYIYNFSEDMLDDMSDELVEKLNTYDALYKSLFSDYAGIMSDIYEAIDEELYLTSGMMPDGTVDPETTAEEQLALLTATNLSPVAVTDVSKVSLATANSAVLGIARIIVDSSYRIEIISSNLESQIWSGKFKVSNLHDDTETDVATSENDIVIEITDDYEAYIQQRVDKMFAKEDSIELADLLSIEDYDTFVEELTKYSLNRLISFEAAFQSCMDILVEMGCGDSETYPDLYNGLYLPYYNKLSAIQAEMTVRADSIEEVQNRYNELTEQAQNIQDQLNLETYLGKDLLDEFLAHRIEDVYRNENYISDGLDNAQLFETAQELISVANKELYRSSNKIFTVTTTLNNLLKIKEFRPLLNKFRCGNWIRIQMEDNEIYKLRLLSYVINFDNSESENVIDVEFSDISKINSMTSDLESILSKASSIAQSYAYVSRQASKGENAQNTIEEIRQQGLDASNTAIMNATSEDVVFGRNGILLRTYDDISGDFLPEQAKLIHNSFNFTTDGWRTSRAALGKQTYVIDGKTYTGYGLNADFCLASTIVGSDIYGTNITGSKINNGNGTFTVDENGNMTASSATITGKLTANAGSKIGGFTSSDEAIFSTKDSLDSSDNGVYLGNDGIALGANNAFKVTSDGAVIANNVNITGGSLSIGSNFSVDITGNLKANNATVTGDITTNNLNATGGKIANFTIQNGYLFNGIGIGQANSCGMSAGTSLGGNDDYIFWAGNNNFRVTKAGIVYAQNIRITGGTLAGWTVTSTDIYDPASVSAGIGKSGTSPAFWAGASYAGRSNAPFRVMHDGSMYATKGTFSATVSGITGTFTSLDAGSSHFQSDYILINANGEGSVRIGTPDYTDWVDLTLRPTIDNKGNIGTPDYRWSTLYSRVIVEGSDRNTKEEIQSYNVEQAYDELRNMPIYTYFYKGLSPETRTMSLGTMIDYIPSEAMVTTPRDNDSFNLSNMLFWSIAACQVMQRKIESLETELQTLKGNMNLGVE